MLHLGPRPVGRQPEPPLHLDVDARVDGTVVVERKPRCPDQLTRLVRGVDADAGLGVTIRYFVGDPPHRAGAGGHLGALHNLPHAADLISGVRL